MMLDFKDKRTISDIRMDRANRALQDAVANYEEARYETAVNRCYYSALNSVRSLLILEGADPETHKGVITMLSLRFVKQNLLHKDVVRKFEFLLTRRTDVDYGDFESVEKNDVTEAIQAAREIKDAVEAVRRAMIDRNESSGS